MFYYVASNLFKMALMKKKKNVFNNTKVQKGKLREKAANSGNSFTEDHLFKELPSWLGW